MPKTSETPHEREQALAYIFEMSSGLAEVAKRHRMGFLVYLLEMAALAANEGKALAQTKAVRRRG